MQSLLAVESDPSLNGRTRRGDPGADRVGEPGALSRNCDCWVSSTLHALMFATFSASDLRRNGGDTCHVAGSSFLLSAAAMPLTACVVSRGNEATSSAALPANDPRREPPAVVPDDKLSRRAVISVELNADGGSSRVLFLPNVAQGEPG